MNDKTTLFELELELEDIMDLAHDELSPRQFDLFRDFVYLILQDHEEE